MARGSGGKDRTRPVVNITSPANLATIVPGTTQLINVSASDNKAVAYVNIRITRQPYSSIDTSNININDVSSPYSYSWNVPNINNTSYDIEATAYDAAGNSSVHRISVRVTDSITTTTTTLAPPPPPPTLPSSWILNAPAAFNQGGEGSCASMSVALNASITYYYHTNATSYSTATNIFSPEFLYNINKFVGGCGAGSSIIKQLDYIKSDGCCRWDLCPYSALPQGCQTTAPNGACDTCIVTPAAIADAANYKVTAYGLVNPTDSYTIKRLIRNGHAISFAANLNSGMHVTDPNYIYCTPGTSGGAHAWVIIGYDDNKQAYLVQNSYGTNYANNGRFWWCYNNFVQSSSTCYWTTYRNDLNLYPFL